MGVTARFSEKCEKRRSEHAHMEAGNHDSINQEHDNGFDGNVCVAQSQWRWIDDSNGDAVVVGASDDIGNGEWQSQRKFLNGESAAHRPSERWQLAKVEAV